VVAKVRERLALNKQKSNIFHKARFNLKQINKVEGKDNTMLRSQIGLQLWKTWTQKWKLIVQLIVLGKRLERIQNFQPKRV
jgi:hypothetical protein